MLAQRRRRWANISPALSQSYVWASSACTIEPAEQLSVIGGLILAQHWVNVMCLLGRHATAQWQPLDGPTDKKKRLTEQTNVNQHVPTSVYIGRDKIIQSIHKISTQS